MAGSYPKDTAELLLLTQYVADSEAKGLTDVDEDLHADLARQIYTLDI
jgi:hypothetical protein